MAAPFVSQLLVQTSMVAARRRYCTYSSRFSMSALTLKRAADWIQQHWSTQRAVYGNVHCAAVASAPTLFDLCCDTQLTECESHGTYTDSTATGALPACTLQNVVVQQRWTSVLMNAIPIALRLTLYFRQLALHFCVLSIATHIYT